MPSAPDLRMFLASEIEWETDGQDVEGLPERVVVMCEDAEEVSGILSNDYGWLIKGMELRLISHGESWLGEVLTASGLAFS